jgi:molybdate transport system substrate-binding protein
MKRPTRREDDLGEGWTSASNVGSLTRRPSMPAAVNNTMEVHVHRRWKATLILCAGLASSNAFAAEIRVFSLPGLTPVMEDLIPKFESGSGNHVRMQYGTLAQAKDVVASGDYDVMIYASPLISSLIQERKIGSIKPIVISHVKIGVAVRSGAQKPDIASGEAFKKAMLAAKSISYTKDSPAGVYLASLMEQLGIAQQMTLKTKLLGGGGQNPKAVAAGDVEIGLSVMPDLVTATGIDIVGTIPADLNPPDLDFAAGINRGSKIEKEAQDLLLYLKSPTFTSTFTTYGMEQETVK